MRLRKSDGLVALRCSSAVTGPQRRVSRVCMTSCIRQGDIRIDFSTARQGTMADKLTPTTLPEYLMWYEALQREIAWFLCQTMLARLQHGATRDEVLRWLLGRPFALTIPPSITQRAREYFQSAYEEATRPRPKGRGTRNQQASWNATLRTKQI
jgi:hypothetical protein